MKILSAAQIRQLDAYTITHESLPSIDLMERAALAFVTWLCSRYDASTPIHIFCGKGNNGGDGLAIARLLLHKHYPVSVSVINHTDYPSNDFSINESKLRKLISIAYVNTIDELPDLTPKTLVIDAILGSGLTRPTSGLVKSVVEKINSSGNNAIAVDIATGLFTDQLNLPEDTIIQPQATVSFQLPKLSFLLPENDPYVGNWTTVPIGLSSEFIENASTTFFYTDENSGETQKKKRHKFSHKGTFGHALLLAGGYGKIGAALLSARSCLHSGAGLLTIHAPACGYVILQSSVPEAMVSVDRNEKVISQLPALSPYKAIGFGPGIGQSFRTKRVLEQLLATTQVPLVLDADALNLLATNTKLLTILPKFTILTPHPKEFERLVGGCISSMERLEKGVEFAKKHQIIICLKGAHTAVILPDGTVHFNSTGNAGMATGGSGDVLTGLVLGLLAQGYPPANAAILGVYLHGKAGDLAVHNSLSDTILASDIIKFI
jgi:hydroxyethylthiazole kinase-like uncharacterized protein yjeF